MALFVKWNIMSLFVEFKVGGVIFDWIKLLQEVKCKNAIRTPLHFLNSASKSLKSLRQISKANNKLFIQAFTLLEEAAPIK